MFNSGNTCSIKFTFDLTHLKRYSMMKKILCTSLVLMMPLSSGFAAESNSSKQLNTQKSAALPAHKTTRIQWAKFPQPQYSNDDLKEQDRAAIIRVYADETGKVTKATVQESTGVNKLDDILIKAVSSSSVKPQLLKDTPLATIGFQTFNLKYYDNDQAECTYQFNSKNWLAQTAQEKTAFTYRTQPQLAVNAEQLNGHNRSVNFSFKVNKHGDVKKVKIKKGSGVYDLDQAVLHAVSNAKVDVPRKFWIYKKSHLKDSIQFKFDGCE